METRAKSRMGLVVSNSDQHEEAVFEAVVQLPSDRRAAHLDQAACSGKPARRRNLSHG